MSTGGARRGRRDNGLDATEFAIVCDVDPRIGEHLLDVLAAAGIAAYLQPSGDLNPITRTMTIPSRPTDRLYVDRDHLATAQDFVTRLTGNPPSEGAASPPEPDIEAEWAKIVAGYYASTEAVTPSWPAAENLTTEDSPSQQRDKPANPDPKDVGTLLDRPAPTRQLPFAGDISGISVDPRADQPSLLDGLDTFGTHLPDDSDDTYHPPPPPPLPHISKITTMAVLAMVAGFVLFLVPTLLPIDRGLATLIGFGGVIGGFVTLIWRLRPGDDDEDDFDDGAVV